MSDAIPLHYLLSSYSDEKLIQAEKDQYQKIIDFSKVFIEKLQDNSITNFDYPFYREYVDTLNFEWIRIRNIIRERKLIEVKREVPKYIIAIHDQVVNSGFDWVFYNATD